jgi:translation initiation factor IF-2
MMTKQLTALAVGGIALVSLSVGVTLKASQAQTAPPPPDRQVRQPGQGQPPFPGQPGQGPQGGLQRPMQIGGGGGGAAMVEDNAFLYVLQGGRLFKVQKSDLKIAAEAMLGGPPRDGRGGFGGPGAPPPGGAGPRPPDTAK